MARKILTFALFVFVLAVLAAPAPAQLIGRTVTVAKLPACNGTQQMALVTDATNATTLGAGGGSASVWVSCASGSWAIEEVAAVTDLTGYVLDSEAAQVSIEASGAGNDVTLLAADDIIFTPADALVISPGGNAAITTTAGAITFTSGGTTEDVSLVSTDDVFLTPDDALVAVAGGNTTITSTAGTVAIASSAGAVTVTAVGATNDVTLTAADDVILAATDALTATGATATVNAGGGAVELSLAAGSTTVIGAFMITKSAAPPVACAAGTEGTLYLDSDTHLLCVCNATGYVQVADGTTGCS